MPDPKLQALLASRYLSGPKADAILARTADGEVKKKKKKRKVQQDAGGLIFKDDSDAWKANDEEDEEDAVTPQVYKSKALDEGRFKKAKLSTVRQGEASTSAAPTPLAETPTPPPAAEPVIRAGLKTKEEIRAERLAREAQEAQQKAEQEAQLPDETEQETVYRDSSGRRIDIKAEEEERKRLAKEEERKKRERDEWGKGLVQRKQREEEKRTLQKMKESDVARRADDADLNKHFKEVEHWDDPALAFMAKKRSKGPRKPKYQGPPPPPNRFGIPPGYRWDGVDRSNGFEKMLFQRKNTLNRRLAEERAWGQEDM